MSAVRCIIGPMETSPRRDVATRLGGYQELPSRPWFLAPPLRVESAPHGEVLTMYTIQSRDAYETLANDGVLVGDSMLGWPEFQEAYAWMLRQMARRLPGAPSAGLLWLWPTATRKQLLAVAKQARGSVLMTVRVERKRVLLSEFLDWHIVLNRSLHVPEFPGESDEEWEARWNELDESFTARAEPYRESPMRELRPEDVVRAVRIR